MYQQTSILAYRKLENIGQKQLRCYDTIKSLGKAANYDIAMRLGQPINTVTPRVKELREMGLVQEAYKDRHPITHRTVIYWEIVQGKEV